MVIVLSTNCGGVKKLKLKLNPNIEANSCIMPNELFSA